MGNKRLSPREYTFAEINENHITHSGGLKIQTLVLLGRVVSPTLTTAIASAANPY